jgi:hypothetical protein
VARVLIVGGGLRSRRLAAQLVEGGSRHAVRVVTRTESGRAAIEATGAECLIGTPDRLATLRGALDGVTVACWLLATARGDEARVLALHGSRLQLFLGQAIDTTMRGFVYEAPDASGPAAGGSDGVPAGVASGVPAACRTVPAAAIAEGERIVRAATSRSAIPLAFVRADPGDLDAWLTDARGAVESLLGVRSQG